MGAQLSMLNFDNKLQISGNGNSALIINGLRYNISDIFNTAVNVAMEKYRSELIFMYFTSISLLVLIAVAVVQCLIARHSVQNRKKSKKVYEISFSIFYFEI